MSLLAAIDPGTSGGIAWQDDAGYVQTCSMANRGEFVEALIKEMRKEWHPSQGLDGDVKIFIELVTGYIAPRKVKPGEKEEFSLAGSGFAMFNFGKSAGVCYGICEAFNIKPVEVSPKTWQAPLFVRKSGTRQQWKSALKDIAQRRFPDLKVTLSNCDALLLLSYAILVTKGQVDTAPARRKVIE